MKTRQLQRRRAPRPGASLALFPFLAVLVCVMGALVPLLLGISRMARRQALAEAQRRAAESQGEIRSELELVAWRIEQLKLSREKTEQDLRQARDQLAHYEDHARRLQAEAQRLENVLRSIDQPQAAGSGQRSQLQTQWEQVQAELAAAQRSLEQAQTAARQRKPSYAVIPYEGPNGTRRRPIYIECTAEAVLIQPEGIRLTADDFRGPLKKDNPLAAVLRAIEAYLDRSGLTDAGGGERPYPLFLVRASGVAAYAAAREAIAAWGSDFGYELIDDDWQLNYPSPDAQLLQVAQAALEQARQIQARLIAAAPRLYGTQRPVYAVSPGRGGVVRIDGPSSTGRYVSQPAAGPIGARLEAPEGRGAADRTTGRLHSGGSAEQQSIGQSPPVGQGQGEAASAIASAASNSPDSATRHGADRPTGALQGRGAVSDDRMQPPLQPGGNPTYRPLPEGVIVPPPPDGPTARTARRDDAPPENAGGNPLRPGQWHPREQTETIKRRDSDSRQEKQEKTKPSIDRRGTDWGLPEVASGAIPLTRSIKIDCHHDRLVMAPEPGASPGKTIALGPRTADAVDELILAVWERIRSWGMAGKAMYWRPVLQVSVVPGAEQRFEELTSLLEGSGLVIQRR